MTYGHSHVKIIFLKEILGAAFTCRRFLKKNKISFLKGSLEKIRNHKKKNFVKMMIAQLQP